MRFEMIALALVALVTPFATASADHIKGKKGHAKPAVVLLHADWRGACEKPAPTFAELKQQYGDRLNYVELNVTNEATTAQATTEARATSVVCGAIFRRLASRDILFSARQTVSTRASRSSFNKPKINRIHPRPVRE
jgi:thiol-disulfide isomerase/thioredoxin